MRIPLRAARPVPTMTAVGVARPRAQGQAITNVVTQKRSAKRKRPVSRQGCQDLDGNNAKMKQPQNNTNNQQNNKNYNKGRTKDKKKNLLKFHVLPSPFSPNKSTIPVFAGSQSSGKTVYPTPSQTKNAVSERATTTGTKYDEILSAIACGGKSIKLSARKKTSK